MYITFVVLATIHSIFCLDPPRVIHQGKVLLNILKDDISLDIAHVINIFKIPLPINYTKASFFCPYNFLLSSVLFQSLNISINISVENGTTCNDPGIPQHAQREEKMSKFNVGMTISFHCDEKYTLIGEHNRTCLPNGTWSNSQPFCKSQIYPMNSLISVILIARMKIFLLLIPSFYPEYMCDKNDVLHPRNGKRIGNNFTIGGEIRFRCSSLYTLIGSNVITCLSNGTWSNKPPKCKRE